MTYYHRNIFLIIGFVLSLTVAYKLAFSKTIKVYTEIKTFKNKVGEMENMSITSENLRQREEYFDSVLTATNIVKTTLQQNLLDYLNKNDSQKNYHITHFRKPHRFNQKDFTISSYQFTINGGYKEILTIIYKLEQKHKLGSVVHLKLEKKHNYKLKTDYLECDVLLQSSK